MSFITFQQKSLLPLDLARKIKNQKVWWFTIIPLYQVFKDRSAIVVVLAIYFFEFPV